MLHGSGQATAWIRRAGLAQSWNDLQLEQSAVEHVEKAVVEELARDVDDLSTIFEGLVDGADISLPCDDGHDGTWIDSLDDDGVDVIELSSAFDVLMEEQGEAMAVSDSGDGSNDEEEDDTDDEDATTDETEVTDSSVTDIADIHIIPSAPVWASMAPLDPRSCIRTPVFSDLDTRIPRVQVPRIDLSFSAHRVVMLAAGVADVSQPEQSMSPPKEKAKVAKCAHNSETCWVCKSSKSVEQKRALHRYYEKRARRNWKRGPRYTGRSNVASSRVRDSGRFTCTTRWI
ncbi:unnamed protein product [Hyaloperonospora brassicae]|uniref:CCT domain-containing protein n=1 Tax=Hyaloperonospora brassicae TaxID=162125 RepID=A0AAV0TPG5_HYABA|nr:unnamed protein product [Hyaloperonospora brassicae]